MLALFRSIHGGARAGSLELPPYDGNLFDPDIHNWLEGCFRRRDDLQTEVLQIDDRTVLHVLRAFQYVEVGTGKGRERRRLSFALLDVEQIGYVYEGLLGFGAFRADDDVLGLIGRPGDEAEVALTEMEDHAAAVTAEGGDIRALAERIAEPYKNSGIGSAAAIAKKLLPDSPLSEERLLAAAQRDLGSQVGELKRAPWRQSTEGLGYDPADLVGVPVLVFPQWLRCTHCNELAPLGAGDSIWQFENDNPYRPDLAQFMHANCKKRGRKPMAVAARFVLACRCGHLDDFPYREFVHRGEDREPGARLRMEDRPQWGHRGHSVPRGVLQDRKCFGRPAWVRGHGGHFLWVRVSRPDHWRR